MVFVVGASNTSIWICLPATATAQDCLAMLHERNLIANPCDERHLLYSHGMWLPLDRDVTMSDLALSDMSTLQYRYRMLGGSSTPPGRLVSRARGYRTELRRREASQREQPSRRTEVQGEASSSVVPSKRKDRSPSRPPSEEPSVKRVEITSPISIADRKLLADLHHIQIKVLQRAVEFGTPVEVVFAKPPSSDSAAYVAFDFALDGSYSANRTPHDLAPVAENHTFLEYEAWLVDALGYAGALESHRVEDVLQQVALLKRCVTRELERLEVIKSGHWDALRTRGIQQPGMRMEEPMERGVTVDNRRFFRQTHASWNSLYLAHHIVAVTMHLLYNVPRRATNILISGVKAASRAAVRFFDPSPHELRRFNATLDDVPRDIRTMVANLDLDPVTQPFVSCPSCYALHTEKPVPLNCSNTPTPSSPTCEAKLWRSRLIKGDASFVAARTYLHQEMKAWVGRLLSRPGVEDVLDSLPYDRIQTPAGTKSDIWDAPALHNIPDPVRPGSNFVSRPPPGDVHSPPEGRYLFALSEDGFNPFQNKEARQNVTCTAIYMVCLNFPPHERFLPENLYLVGIIPGPGKPSLDQINHALRPLVDELLMFYEHGVYYTRTAKYDDGRLVRLALGPLVCDLPAARQVAGFGGQGSTFFCSCCSLSLDKMDNLDTESWVKRDGQTHKTHARDWRDAPSQQDRDRIFAQHGVRWSELCRLPYWDPVTFTVIDTMHNHYLGLLQDHCRNIWGMDISIADGDGQHAQEYVTFARPPRVDMQAGWYYLKAKSTELDECTEAVLWHMCLELDLRRPKPHKDGLLRALRNWQSDEANELPPDIVDLIANFSSTTYKAPSRDVALAESAYLKGDDKEKLSNRPKPVLEEMCRVRGLTIEGTRAKLAERLVHLRASSAQGSAPVAQESRIARIIRPSKSKATSAVLGRETLAEVHTDLNRTTVPSWVSPVPKNAGTKQHGKLSADQWRTLCTIHLPITLIRIWGQKNEGSRERRMLDNFLDLVTAVEVAGMLITSDAHIAEYQRAILRYLRTMQDLYKDAPFKPNHHLAIHVGDTILPQFGPLHPIRAFHTERNNFTLQMENTNMKFGEIELTYMTHTCRAANLKYLLRDHAVYEAVYEMIDAYGRVDGEDRRGTRLRETFSRAANKAPEAKRRTMEDWHLALLAETLNSAETTPVYKVRSGLTSSQGTIYLPEQANYLSHLQASGVTYRPFDQSPRDSYISFVDIRGSAERSGRIDAIFEHTRRGIGLAMDEITETFLVVSPFEELSPAESQLDPFRRYGWVGGALYYDAIKPMIVVHSARIVCHIAKTPMHVHGISRDCVHTHTLNRLLQLADRLGDENLAEDLSE